MAGPAFGAGSGLEIAFEDDAPGFASDLGGLRPPAGRAGADGAAAPSARPADTVHAPLQASELLARFRAHRPGWFAGLDAESAGIDAQLADEAALSARWGGLPGTDHRSAWDGGADRSVPRRGDRQAEWQPPLWVMTPVVRRRAGTLRLRLPPALTPEALQQAILDHCPPAWRTRERVAVRLEIETRIYWGARAPDDTRPWRTVRERGDGIGLSDLMEIDRGAPRWLLPGADAVAPVIERSLRAGVGLLVAVPVILYEKLPRPLSGWSRLVQWLLDRWDRLRGVRRDRDPTFVDRLQADETYWAAGLDQRPRSARVLKQAFGAGALLAPASRPACAPTDAAPLQVVLLHGGLSSARAGFEAWLAAGTAPPASQPLWPQMPLFDRLPVWRFEHDSFLPLDANIERLTTTLQQQVIGARPRGRLVLLAHSRGGAVARFALPVLRDRWPGWDFHALTAGGPHAGTAVFERLGQRWVGLAGIVGLVGGALHDSASRALLAKLKNLERGLAGDIPTGFRDVLPDSIAARAAHGEWPAQLVTWGSQWRADLARDWSARGWHHVIEDIGGFEADGDGLVPHDSAMHAPHAHDASPAFHTEYFAHPPTAAQMRALLEELAAPR